MRTRPAALPPFRTLDPTLATAERLLAAGDPRLTPDVESLPDEHAADAVLAGAGVRLRAQGDAWRVVHVATAAATPRWSSRPVGSPAWSRWRAGGD
jgi:hypothetical protein